MRPTLRFFIVLTDLLLAASFLLPIYFNGPYPHPPGPVFDQAANRNYLHEIEAQQPEIVLLGDSQLTKGVEKALFQSRTDTSTYKLDIPGSSSALWYLMLKNNILPARPAPRLVVVTFRDTLLTAPTFRTTGPYFGLIDRFARPADTFLIERAYIAGMSPWEKTL